MVSHHPSIRQSVLQIVSMALLHPMQHSTRHTDCVLTCYLFWVLQPHRMPKPPTASPQPQQQTHLAWPSPVAAPSYTKLSPAGLLLQQLCSMLRSTSHSPLSLSHSSPPATFLLSLHAGARPSRQHLPATALTHPQNPILQEPWRATHPVGTGLITCLT